MTHLTTRLVILVVLVLMIVTGAYDYVRLLRERDHMIEQTGDDVRIFAETLALATRRNLRGGRTTDELQELLDEILARPGLALVVIFDPTGRVVAQSATPDVPPATVDAMVQKTLSSRAPVSTVLATRSDKVLLEGTGADRNGRTADGKGIDHFEESPLIGKIIAVASAAAADVSCS